MEEDRGEEKTFVEMIAEKKLCKLESWANFFGDLTDLYLLLLQIKGIYEALKSVVEGLGGKFLEDVEDPDIRERLRVAIAGGYGEEGLPFSKLAFEVFGIKAAGAQGYEDSVRRFLREGAVIVSVEDSEIQKEIGRFIGKIEPLIEQIINSEKGVPPEIKKEVIKRVEERGFTLEGEGNNKSLVWKESKERKPLEIFRKYFPKEEETEGLELKEILKEILEKAILLLPYYNVCSRFLSSLEGMPLSVLLDLCKGSSIKDIENLLKFFGYSLWPLRPPYQAWKIAQKGLPEKDRGYYVVSVKQDTMVAKLLEALTYRICVTTTPCCYVLRSPMEELIKALSELLLEDPIDLEGMKREFFTKTLQRVEIPNAANGKYRRLAGAIRSKIYGRHYLCIGVEISGGSHTKINSIDLRHYWGTGKSRTWTENHVEWTGELLLSEFVGVFYPIWTLGIGCVSIDQKNKNRFSIDVPSEHVDYLLAFLGEEGAINGGNRES